MWEHTKRVSRSCFHHIHAFRKFAAALVSSRLDYTSSILYVMSRRRGAWHVCSAFKIQLQEPYYNSHHYPHGTHFSNFIGFPSNAAYNLSGFPFTYLQCQYSIISVWTPPYVPSRTLRSSANLHVPRTNLHFGSCSFYIAAATVWKFSPSHSSFVSNLKYFLKTS